MKRRTKLLTAAQRRQVAYALAHLRRMLPLVRGETAALKKLAKRRP